MAYPRFDSRIAVAIPGALDLTCELIRRGYTSASLVRLQDHPAANQADVAIIPSAATADTLESAIACARRMLASNGVLVLRLAKDRTATLSHFAREQLLRNAFTAIRVDATQGEVLLRAERATSTDHPASRRIPYLTPVQSAA